MQGMPEAGMLPAQALPPQGTVLAFDFGAKRIGVAVGETVLAQAHPLMTIHAQTVDARFTAIANLVKEWQPCQFVVGMPGHLDDRDAEPHPLAIRCRRFANQLQGRFHRPVIFVDERLSSFDAEHCLRQSGHTAKQSKPHLDAVAAQLILQTYFDIPPHQRQNTN